MSSETSTNTLQPWQFFVLAALGCATAVTFIARSRGPMVVVLLTLIMAAAALVGIAVLRAVSPLVTTPDDRSAVIGQRTRAGLEQEKALAFRTIKELEFDRAMGKVSDDDFREMSVRLRARAARLMKQLDTGASYRPQIEQEVAKRMEKSGEKSQAAPACVKCASTNDPDARFCKNCGERLA